MDYEDVFQNYTVEAVAHELGCCEATIRNRIKTGEILAFRVGRKYQITKEELLRVLQLAFDQQRKLVAAHLRKQAIRNKNPKKKGCS